ncbi:MAG: hypothetical protein UW41_C0025G0020 [Candidatus Collierbacteria bacterium GW2011_GWC2_44_18]|uniref:Uncharacterized protein n=1 Tax=Candidatus Collierbacteria bacterium GW2011_GWC2_44_18 TaxID=1618392 RepID=A0A0G1KKS8_9BACT|nr:MAG: hypothetical protein UW41_C0025G0020 [Candidatus Collierbacteria bacterium GW2011_GWC2_44_18]
MITGENSEKKIFYRSFAKRAGDADDGKVWTAENFFSDTVDCPSTMNSFERGDDKNGGEEKDKGLDEKEDGRKGKDNKKLIDDGEEK